ncbi:MAG: signal peptidase I [Christensenellales bacterium]
MSDKDTPDMTPTPQAAQPLPPEGKKKVRKEKKKLLWWQEVLSWAGYLLAAVVLAMLIRGLLLEPVRVDGHSMDNTLADGEIMLVTKPEVLLNQLKRGDVVIVRYPGRSTTATLEIAAPLDISLTSHTLFVKRLVALPGDAVAMLDGKLYVNDKPVEESFIDYPALGDYARRVLGEDQYMVMGDNRANSHDSRASDVGPISRGMIVGHAKLVLFPLDKIRVIH